MDLVQKSFRDGVFVEEVTWQAVLLIPEGGGGYQGIGLVEVVWKALTVILNFRFAVSIAYHDYLHGFWSFHVTGTASLDVKIL